MFKEKLFWVYAAIIFIVEGVLVYQFSYSDTRAVDGPITWGFPFTFFTQGSGMVVRVDQTGQPTGSLAQWNYPFLGADIVIYLVVAFLGATMISYLRKKKTV